MDGILFRPELIKKIVAGEKDVTRRLSGLEEINKEPDEWKCTGWANSWQGFGFDKYDGRAVTDDKIIRPRYHIGQVLFIREAWATIWHENNFSPNEFHKYTHPIWFKDTDVDKPTKCGDDMGRWRSPLHLPARFARHFIQVKDIRAERLQEITPEEAVREGCGDLGIIPSNTAMLMTGTTNLEDCSRKLTVAQFASLWDSINPDHPFASNPHVFRIEFKYLKDYKYLITK
jgi:hypothetical protein